AKRKGVAPKVLMQVGSDPLVAVGKRSYLHEALEAMGVRNLYGDLDQTYPRPSREDVVKRKPDLILVIAMESDSRRAKRAATEWRSLVPLKGTRVEIFPGDGIARP